MMDQLIARFGEQLEEALQIGAAAKISKSRKVINKIYVAGLGGSGIGGDFVSAIIRKECEVPYLIGKGYDIPKYIDDRTLAIISSYSGNTEETVSAFKKIEKTEHYAIAPYLLGRFYLKLDKFVIYF